MVKLSVVRTTSLLEYMLLSTRHVSRRHRPTSQHFPALPSTSQHFPALPSTSQHTRITSVLCTTTPCTRQYSGGERAAHYLNVVYICCRYRSLVGGDHPSQHSRHPSKPSQSCLVGVRLESGRSLVGVRLESGRNPIRVRSATTTTSIPNVSTTLPSTPDTLPSLPRVVW